MMLRRSVQRLVYDLDDAVMYDGDGSEDRRRQSRFAAMMRAADLVVCGNQYLADEASRLTDRVTIVPTSIDTEAYHPRLRSSESGRVTIGWTGSRSTNPYLNDVLPILSKLHGPIAVKIISETVSGIELFHLGHLPQTFVPWSPEIEITQAATFDIGVMPVPDNPFTQGKCGFKATPIHGTGNPRGVQSGRRQPGHHPRRRRWISAPNARRLVSNDRTADQRSFFAKQLATPAAAAWKRPFH